MPRDTQQREVIVVEGYTEESYLAAVRDWDKSREFAAKLLLAKGQGGVIPALRRRNLDAYSTVWVVLDAERHPHTVCERVRKHVENRTSPQYRLIITSPRIETWLLAHYQVPTGDGPKDEEILKNDHGYDSKRNLPSDFDPSAWRTAMSRMAGLQAPAAPGCELCIPQSQLPSLVARLRGESV